MSIIKTNSISNDCSYVAKELDKHVHGIYNDICFTMRFFEYNKELEIRLKNKFWEKISCINKDS